MLLKFLESEDDDERSEILKEKGEEIAYGIDEEIDDDVDELYDETPEAGSEGLYGLDLNEGLTEAEISLAPLYASLSRGLMVVTGAPGSGKGVFSNHLAWQQRRLFKDKRVLLDYRLRRLFDLGQEDNRYILFNSEFFDKEVAKMAASSGTTIIRENDTEHKYKTTQKVLKDNTQKLAKEWFRNNELLFVNAHMNLDEFKRYFHNRNPMNPMGIKLGHIITMWRHMGMLILGMCPYLSEIDQYSVIPYMSHEVKCSWSTDGNTTFASFYKKKSVTTRGVINVEGKPVRLRVNGGKPLPEIGVQLRLETATMHDYGDKENAIVEYLQIMDKGLANLNMIHDNAVDEDINNLSERLLYMHGEGIVSCKRFFDIFNSQNILNPLPPK
jgi:hypothetical protein